MVRSVLNRGQTYPTIKLHQRLNSQDIAITFEVRNCAHSATFSALKMDGSTLRENGQDTLFALWRFDGFLLSLCQTTGL